RASSSIVLNLAEGAGRATRADQNRFFSIAFGSLRECQAILDLHDSGNSPASELADKLAAHLFRLIHGRAG
ncbi:MAG: four helix bundle protein, partial [Oligoflexia bacterium]|nr:four helix bundle protein [Oligoflexia bacterium]